MVTVNQKIDVSFSNVMQHLKGQFYFKPLSRDNDSFLPFGTWTMLAWHPSGHCRSAIRPGGLIQHTHGCTHAQHTHTHHTTHPSEYVYKEEMDLIGWGRSGEAWLPPEALQVTGTTLSSFHAFLKGILPLHLCVWFFWICLNLIQVYGKQVRKKRPLRIH